MVNHVAELGVGCGAERRRLRRARREHQVALDEIREHAAHDLVVVAAESIEHVLTAHDGLRADEVVDGLPQRAAALRRALFQPLHLALVGAKRHPEHVGAHLAAHALRFELPRQLDEHLIRHVRERRPEPAARRELRDEHRRLPHDRVDEQIDVHAPETTRPAHRRGDVGNAGGSRGSGAGEQVGARCTRRAARRRSMNEAPRAAIIATTATRPP
jgi:hypothetical protein